MSTMEVVASNVSALRQRAKLTQAELAVKCCVSRPRIAEIESGRYNPTISTVETIAQALGVDVSRLFTRRRAS